MQQVARISAWFDRRDLALSTTRRAKPERINLGLGFRDFLRNSSTDGITSLLEPKRSIGDRRWFKIEILLLA
jgi:hypothetical protein